MAKTKELIIQNKLGLHARASALFVQTANKFKSEVFVEKAGQKVNGKSIMGVMMLAAAKGSVIKVEVNGPDETEALDQISSLVDDKFKEEK